MTTIVLGWDGLDHELLQTYDVAASFGRHANQIETIVNPELGKPHTWELWPSIITGMPPDKHGIHAEAFIENGGFESPWLSVAAKASRYTVPDALRWRIGRALRNRGATFDFHTLEYYQANGLETVFDAYHALPIGVPNARSEFDASVGLEQDRGAYLADYLEATASDDGVREAAVPMDVLRSRVEGDMAAKLAFVRANRDAYDLVFVWLAYIDTLGHVAPTTSDPDAFMQSVYETAARYTQRVRQWSGSDERVVCVSDHGLQDGQHTDTAAIAGAEHVADASSILDVPDIIHTATTASSTPDTAATPTSDAARETRERLQDLGYL